MIALCTLVRWAHQVFAPDLEAATDDGTGGTGGVTESVTYRSPGVSLLVAPDEGLTIPAPLCTCVGQACELRDGGSRYSGKGVLQAVKNVNDILGPMLIGMDPTKQEELDDVSTQVL